MPRSAVFSAGSDTGGGVGRMSQSAPPVTARRCLRPGDVPAIVELHERVYVPEFARNTTFLDRVIRSVEAAIRRGWPESSGAVWLIDGDDARLDGCLALTREGPLLGRVRWFVLAPELRGRGLGQQMLAELLDEARRQHMERLTLDTFTALRAAGHIYRSAGFRLASAIERDDWGPTITYQTYELEL